MPPIARWIVEGRPGNALIDPRVVFSTDGTAGVGVLPLLHKLEIMRLPLRYLLLALLLSSTRGSQAAPGESDGTARVNVTCSRSSAFVNVSINNYRPIGKVVIEVVDAQGRTWYKEEGKALTPELVRRLDKGGFPKASLTLKVRAKDFEVSRPFTIE